MSTRFTTRRALSRWQRALCGNVAYANGAFHATDHAVMVKDKGANNPKYIYHILTHANLNQYKTSGAQPGLSVARLDKIVIPVPPLELQEKIVAILDRFEALVNDLSQGLPAEIAATKEQYEYYRNNANIQNMHGSCVRDDNEHVRPVLRVRPIHCHRRSGCRQLQYLGDCGDCACN